MEYDITTSFKVWLFYRRPCTQCSNLFLRIQEFHLHRKAKINPITINTTCTSQTETCSSSKDNLDRSWMTFCRYGEDIAYDDFVYLVLTSKSNLAKYMIELKLQFYETVSVFLFYLLKSITKTNIFTILKRIRIILIFL